jgi:phage gpG-like protein
MSGTVITVGFDDSTVRRHLAMLALRDARKYDGARREIGEYLVGEIQDNFHDQRLADGTPMPASAAAVARQGKTLIAKGHLRDSYVYQLTREGLEVGSAKIYAAIHHVGGATGRGHKTHIIPRPVMGIGDEQQREIGDILLSAVRGVR